MPRVLFALLLLLAALLPHPQEARASAPTATRQHTTVLPYGTRCRYYAPEITFPGPRPGYHCIYPGPVYLDLAPKIRHTPAKKAAKRAPARRAKAPAQPRGRWVRVFTTGYDDTGYTASGLLAGYGRVAVDPRVFRLGTRFYIPGYGYAVAADTGGAVIGYRVDLWFPTASQCYANTGWRNIEVLN